MEIEYKWNLPRKKTLKKLIEDELTDESMKTAHQIHMHATYYDTSDRYIHRKRGSLRLRQEGDKSVCSLKISQKDPDGYRIRHEFEVSAKDIAEGLNLLPTVGAPKDICEKFLSKKLRPTCETYFNRCAYVIEDKKFSAELAVDEGELRNHGLTAPISEIELEYISGDLEAFHKYARKLQDKYELQVEPRSKHSRAFALQNE